jgi:hypothetical protein
MNWEAVAAVAELLGALGMIASLIYLAGQVRSSGRQASQSAIQSVVNKMNEVWNRMATEANADIWTRGSKGFAHLEGEKESVQFSALLLSIFKPFEEIFHYRQDGLVADWVWESPSLLCETLMSTPGTREWWERRRGWFSSSFRDYIGAMSGQRPGYERHEQPVPTEAS